MISSVNGLAVMVPVVLMDMAGGSRDIPAEECLSLISSWGSQKAKGCTIAGCAGGRQDNEPGQDV
jgi:hypothetical protein